MTILFEQLRPGDAKGAASETGRLSGMIDRHVCEH